MNDRSSLYPAEIHSEGVVFHSPHLKVDAAELVWPPRRKGAGEVRHTHYRVRRREAVGVLVLDHRAGEFLFVEQFRYPVAERSKGVLLEIPAGVVDEGETPQETARREVLEEIGIAIENPVPFARTFSAPGYSDELVHLFFAQTHEEIDDGGGADPGERTRRVRLPVGQTHRLWENGEIADLKTFAALAWYFARQGFRADPPDSDGSGPRAARARPNRGTSSRHSAGSGRSASGS